MPLFSFASVPGSLSVETTVEDGVTVVACQGEIDIATAPKLDAALLAAPDTPLVLDLCACDFIGSIGLRVLMKHHRRPDGFVIACIPSGAPTLLFDLAGLSQNGKLNPSAFRTFLTREAAIASFADTPAGAAF